jgi:hypothetical protein
MHHIIRVVETVKHRKYRNNEDSSSSQYVALTVKEITPSTLMLRHYTSKSALELGALGKPDKKV